MSGKVTGKARKGRRLTADAVVEIRQSSEPRRVLAARFGVTVKSIENIQNGVTWPYVTPARAVFRCRPYRHRNGSPNPNDAGHQGRDVEC